MRCTPDIVLFVENTVLELFLTSGCKNYKYGDGRTMVKTTSVVLGYRITTIHLMKRLIIVTS